MGVSRRLLATTLVAALALTATSASAGEGDRDEDDTEAEGAEADDEDDTAGDDDDADAPTATGPVQLDVLVTERGPRRPWRLRVTNVSDEPLRVVADPRLMSFEVTVPNKDKPVHCDLPNDMTPNKAVPAAVVWLKPGRSVVRRFDPRMFCFTTGEQTTLVPGSVVAPTFGWKTPTKTVWKKGHRVEEPLPEAPPWVAEPARETSGLEPIKNAPAAPITLGPDYAAWAPPEDEEDRDPLALSIRKGIDAQDERGVVLTVRLQNTSKYRQRVFFRRELITFEVFGPDGLGECQAEPDARNPPPVAFTSLGAGSSSSLATRLVELCPRGTFGRPGLYLVGARLDATVDGAEYGLDTFTGTIRTDRPVAVRVRKGEDPFFIGLRRRPRGGPRGKAPSGTAPEPGAPAAPQPAPAAPPPPPQTAPPPAPPPSGGGPGSDVPPRLPRRPRPPRESPS